MSERICANCRHFAPLIDDSLDPSGECRRCPPRLSDEAVRRGVKLELVEQYDAKKLSPEDFALDRTYRECHMPWSWVFPIIGEHEWCGEWVERPVGEVQRTVTH